MKIGVLALQGDVREHVQMLQALQVGSVLVTLPEHLGGIDGLIIPGGESTTIGLLMARYGLDKAVISRHKQGMGIFGTCAGAILLAKDILGSSQPRLGIMDISVARNDYGRQADSFEAAIKDHRLELPGKPLKAAFIRAPVIKKISDGCKVVAKLGNSPVLVRQHRLLTSTFHPELVGETRVHKYFLGMLR
ncbi:pyridoxal 5'-phosphate synthase glutaminase subunit PdxT [Candidatus Woesearchaeota archaeon]|nr:pyridoxal 5'-phosphate synthase glutaminase subunit PdxT [Candidatus Woesearchaeota archaeon]